jgi:hypothetical protein
MFDSAEVWPSVNESEERALQQALESLVDRPQDEVIRRVMSLEKQHGDRRAHPWQKLGLSPLATALKPLAQLATLCQTTRCADSRAFADLYASEGWRVDAAALAPWQPAAHQSSTVRCWGRCGLSICRGWKLPPATCNN